MCLIKTSQFLIMLDGRNPTKFNNRVVMVKYVLLISIRDERICLICFHREGPQRIKKASQLVSYDVSTNIYRENYISTIIYCVYYSFLRQLSLQFVLDKFNIACLYLKPNTWLCSALYKETLLLFLVYSKKKVAFLYLKIT